jgi:hypothetical protein
MHTGTVGVTRDPRWRSGAVMAVLVAAAGVGAHVALRPASEGPAPSPAYLGLALLALAAVLWPLASRTTRMSALTGLFALAQFAPRAVAFGLDGGGDLRSVLCCPPAERVSPGVLGELTADAGWALATAQLLACLLLAVALCGGRALTDAVAFAGAAVRGALTRAQVLLVRGRLLRPTTPVGGYRILAVAPPPPPLPLLGRIAAGRIARRGPPRRIRQYGPGAALSRRFLITAAG